jgi:hypothetical protein
MLQTPVCLIIFNRPDTTARVFSEIAKARPSKLFVVADGPRVDRQGEAERCARARSVIERVDWDCDVMKNYSDENLGCGRRPATGISWVFKQVDEAIILEDDCVPHPTFFPFCEELLERYRRDERVMCISGINLGTDHAARPFSYRFSCLNPCWGWASWRRAWLHFDMMVTRWAALRETSWLADILEDQRSIGAYKSAFDRALMHQGEVDYWDYQWTFACWAQQGLSIVPSTALVTNIGFGEEATHTKSMRDPRARHAAPGIRFPLAHPPGLAVHRRADRYLIRQITVLNQGPKNTGYDRLRKQWNHVLIRHPSLKSPRAFFRRLAARSAAAIAWAARKLMASLAERA